MDSKKEDSGGGGADEGDLSCGDRKVEPPPPLTEVRRAQEEIRAKATGDKLSEVGQRFSYIRNVSELFLPGF